MTDWVDKMPELKARLEKGSVTFADFGCGSGRSRWRWLRSFQKVNSLVLIYLNPILQLKKLLLKQGKRQFKIHAMGCV